MNDYAEFRKQYQEQLEQAVANANMPPEILEQFDFDNCLKANTQKEIYIVKRKSDGVKALLRITKDYPEEDAVQEAEILKTLNHPGIPKVFASYEHGGRSFIVREYFEGETLADLVQKNGAMSPKEIREFVPKICDILSYLHGQEPSVIHRDLKPQNIIMTTNGDVKLIDFGIAREYDSTQVQDTTVILTKPYAPPEQFGYTQSDSRSDIYSLGKVLFFLATDDQEGAERIKDHHDIAASQSLILRQDNLLREAIAQCLRFDPARRFPSVQVLMEFMDSQHSAFRTPEELSKDAIIQKEYLDGLSVGHAISLCVQIIDRFLAHHDHTADRLEIFRCVCFSTNYLSERLDLDLNYIWARSCPYCNDSSKAEDLQSSHYALCDRTCDGAMYTNCKDNEAHYSLFHKDSKKSSTPQEIIDHTYNAVDAWVGKHNAKYLANLVSESAEPLIKTAERIVGDFERIVSHDGCVKLPERWEISGPGLFYGTIPDYMTRKGYIFATSMDIIEECEGEVLGTVDLIDGAMTLPKRWKKRAGDKIFLTSAWDHFELFFDSFPPDRG